MQTWHTCLVQGIDYLHGMKVKHGDQNPANTLIMETDVLITGHQKTSSMRRKQLLWQVQIQQEQ
jgi:hypothetical protein